MGERAPIWYSKIRGIFFGLSKDHEKKDLIISILVSYIQDLNIAKQLSYGVTAAGVLQLIFLIYFSFTYYKPSIKFKFKITNQLKPLLEKFTQKYFSKYDINDPYETVINYTKNIPEEKFKKIAIQAEKIMIEHKNGGNPQEFVPLATNEQRRGHICLLFLNIVLPR